MATMGKKKKKLDEVTPPKPLPPPKDVDKGNDESSDEEDDKEMQVLKSLECKLKILFCYSTVNNIKG